MGFVYGPLTRLGLVVAAVTCVLDQGLKLWLIYVFRLGAKGLVALGPLVTLVMTWNPGISYGLFQQDNAVGRLVLLAVNVIAVLLLWTWLAQVQARLSAAALGLVVGGAVGNIIDRLAYGAVADFVLLHTPDHSFNWYVFNLADAAIVAGVALLLYESVVPGRAAKAP